MKKFYEVYAEYWDKEERQWCLGKYTLWKFCMLKILFLYYCFNNCSSVESYRYISPKNVMIEY